MKLQAHALSDPGKKRTKNEDSFFCDGKLGLFIVCDGVGGQAAGKLASETVIQIIRKSMEDSQSLLDTYKKQRTPENRIKITQFIEGALQAANKAVRILAAQDPAKSGMATTADVLLITGDYAFLGHVGDSRIYQLRAGQVHQLTLDHSVSAEMLSQGIWTPEQAAASPYSHTLTRAVGHQEFVKVDTLEVELTEGDVFLLCTDGLHNYFKSDELLQTVVTNELSHLPEALVKFALRSGGADNVTAVVVRVDDELKVVSKEVNVLQKTEILRSIPLFRYLNHRELARILSLTATRSFATGTRIIEQGKPGLQIFIVLNGEVEIKKDTQSLAKRGRGEIIGEMAIIDNSPRSASVFTTAPTLCLVMEQKNLFALFRKEPQLAVKFLWALSQALNQTLRSTTELLVHARSDLESLKNEGPFIELDRS